MKKVKQFVTLCTVLAMCVALAACSSTQDEEIRNTYEAGNILMQNQPTPTDLEYSLERYNLIRRAYWVNGQVEKARNLPCAVEKPLSYVVLIAEGVGVVGQYVVDGKVTSLNSFLTPDSERYATSSYADWLPDVDGSFGNNVDGCFFFTADGNYYEWNGKYLYSDVPFILETPTLVTTSADNLNNQDNMEVNNGQ